MSDGVPTLRELQVAIGIVVRDGRVLICRRPPHVELPSAWELPGGKIEPGETPEAAAVRELAEETGLVVAAILRLPSVTHTYPHARITLTPVVCRVVQGNPRPIGCTDCRWVLPTELDAYAFPAANAFLPQWIRTAILQTSAAADNLL